MSQEPLVFEHYFQVGEQESFSPFLKPKDKKLASGLNFRVSLFSAFLFISSLSMSYYAPFQGFATWLLVLIFAIVGAPALIDAIEDLTDFDVNIDLLMTLAAFAAAAIGNPYEGALLLVLFAISGGLEEKVSEKAQGAIYNLKRLNPTQAILVRDDGSTIQVALSEVQKGQKILVQSGQIVPLDGLVIEGKSDVDLVHLTGESLPVTKNIGDDVPSGALLHNGYLKIEVTTLQEASTLSQIVDLIHKAQEAKPKLQMTFEKFSRAYALTIISLSALFFALMPFFFPITYFEAKGSFYRSLAFLIAASPCALILAIPISYICSISRCARLGVILRGGVILDALSQCQSIAFDKTGTLTEGKLSCEKEEIIANPVEDESLFWSYVAAIEKLTTHPIGECIAQYALSRCDELPTVVHYENHVGKGIEGLFEDQGKKLFLRIGSLSWIEGLVDETTAQNLKALEAHEESKDLLIVGIEMSGHVRVVYLRDSLRPNIKELIQQLKQLSLETKILSGDRYRSVERIARQAGISEFYADLSPEDKLSLVSQTANESGLVMVGDGINDAPALSRATVGISMGKVASQTAMSVADVVILNDNLDILSTIINQARRTVKIVKQNLFLALGVISIVSLSALFGFVPLWLAVILHEGGTVIVGLNGLRLLR